MSVYCKNRPPRPGSLIQVKADKHKPPLPRRRDPMSGLLGPPRLPQGPPRSGAGPGLPGTTGGGVHAEKHTEPGESLKAARSRESPGRRKALPGILFAVAGARGKGRNSHPWAGSCSAAFSSAAPALCSASAPIAASHPSHRPQQGGPPASREPAWSGSGQTGDCLEHSREPRARGLHPSSLCR